MYKIYKNLKNGMNLIRKGVFNIKIFNSYFNIVVNVMHILTSKQIKAKQTKERLMLDVFHEDMRRQFPGRSESLLSIIKLILIAQNDICVS